MNLGNYKKLGIIGFIITTLISIIAIYFNSGEKNIDNKTTINHVGNGNIISNSNGNNIIINPIEKMVDETKILRQPIFDVLKQIEDKDLSIDRIELSKKYYGLEVIGNGYIQNVVANDNDEKSYLVILSENKGSYFDLLLCTFNNTWNKRLSILKAGEEIKFKGIIKGFNDTISVNNCELVD